MDNKKLFFRSFFIVGDIALMYFALLLALAVRYNDFSFLPGLKTKIFIYHFSFIYAFWIFLLFVFDFYEIPPIKKAYDFLRNLIVFFVFAAIFGIVYFYLQPQVIISPKTLLALNISIFSFLLIFWRAVLKNVFQFQRFKENIAVIGFRPEFLELIPEIIKQNGYDLIVFFSPDSARVSETEKISKYAKMGFTSDILQLKKIINEERVDSIVVALDAEKKEASVQQIFENLPLRLNYISFIDFYKSLTKKVPLGTIDELWFLENISRATNKIEETAKRTFDLSLSVVGLVITFLLLPFLALLIKTDSSGPVFYKQKRVGREGRIFTILKFRTMKINAEENGPQWASQNDERITNLGKILRRLYLDEFPQFFNIFKGELSFVGPRPERPEFVELLQKQIPYYNIRHLVKPGFTGWAQINYHYGASVEEAKEKLQYDLYYIKNRSFLLDLMIILRTIRIIF